MSHQLTLTEKQQHWLAHIQACEPFPFKPTHVSEFLALTGNNTDTRCEFIDGEMTSWYGSRALEGLRYLRELATALTKPGPR